MRRFRRRKNEDQIEDPDIIEGEVEEIEQEEAVAAPPPVEKQGRGFFRRRTQETQAPLGTQEAYAEASSEAGFPLERVAPDIPTPDESTITEYTRRPAQPRPAKRRLRLPNILAWGEVNPGMLLLAVGLVVGGVFWMLYNRGQTSEAANAWWPMVLLAGGFLWSAYALAMRRVPSFLAANALMGVSFSLWLDAQDYLEWQQTMAGCILVAVGLGIIARGFLLRQGSTA
jgi:hypothetical protein